MNEADAIDIAGEPAQRASEHKIASRVQHGIFVVPPPLIYSKAVPPAQGNNVAVPTYAMSDRQRSRPDRPPLVIGDI
jgi:hypothetical protein